MAEDNKELMKRDLVIIKKLHKKTDYTQRDKLKSIYDYALSKDLFKSKLGEKYLARLLSLYEEKNVSNTCIICGKTCEYNPIVCNQCNQKLLGSEADQKSEVPNDAPLKIDPPIPTKELMKEVVPAGKTQIKQPKAKKNGNKIGAAIILLLFICFIISHFTAPNENTASSVKKNNVATENNKKDSIISSKKTPAKSTSNNTNIKKSKQHQLITDNSKSVNNDIASKSKPKINKAKNTKQDYFNFTENELMSRIQDTLVKNNLDIGTKEGYPHIFFVLDHGMVSNVVYQVALNSNGKVVTISVNISTPVSDLTIFSRAVTTAILSCDSTITKAEMKSLVNNIHSNKITKINGISYFAGATSNHILTYGITKAHVPNQLKNHMQKNKKNNTSKPEMHELSPLLGTTPDNVHSKLGTPISTSDNTEYYSDLLSIVYDNGVAYKIILGIEERYDFTQKVIPKSNYTIQNIRLNDSEASVHNNSKNSSLFISDGVFYGNTYQIEQDGYYVNVDYFTLQDGKECPVYRLVLTRLNQVN